jgi:hypothetical protein
MMSIDKNESLPFFFCDMNESEPQKKESSREVFEACRLVASSCSSSWPFFPFSEGKVFAERGCLNTHLFDTSPKPGSKKAGGGDCWGAGGTHKTWIHSTAGLSSVLFGVFFFFRCVEAGGGINPLFFLELYFPSDLSLSALPQTWFKKAGGILGERKGHKTRVFDLGETRKRDG